MRPPIRDKSGPYVAPELKTIGELLIQNSEGKIPLTREEKERVKKHAENVRKSRLNKLKRN